MERNYGVECRGPKDEGQRLTFETQSQQKHIRNDNTLSFKSF